MYFNCIQSLQLCLSIYPCVVFWKLSFSRKILVISFNIQEHIKYHIRSSWVLPSSTSLSFPVLWLGSCIWLDICSINSCKKHCSFALSSSVSETLKTGGLGRSNVSEVRSTVTDVVVFVGLDGEKFTEDIESPNVVSCGLWEDILCFVGDVADRCGGRAALARANRRCASR